jgi:hypothetical protein
MSKQILFPLKKVKIPQDVHDDSHVRRQTPDSFDAERSRKNKRFPYGQKPKMGRE